ncbi:MAG TPA: hypothetical protein VFW47_18190 [Phenylobacterium sp.]|nr:hypothetical protein [Phenylobacterium sp.]
MSLAQFQTALADLTASPALVRQVRREPATLTALYDLTEREARRLAGVAASPGMEANCMLYRANRLAPVALNLPDTCTALGDDLEPLISAYWDSEPQTDVHFLIEADRFARYVAARELTADARAALSREHALVAGKLAASRARAGLSAFRDGPAEMRA